MLNYVATANHRYTIDVLLRDWAPELRPHFRVLSYEQLTSERVLPEGRWVLTDFERLRGPLAGFATAMYRVLRRSGRTVLNDPTRALSRRALLDTLHERGIIVYAAHRPLAAMAAGSWPMFLRQADEHRVLSPLLHTRRALAAASARGLLRGTPLHRQLAVEFCDTRDSDGMYPKMSAYYVAGRVVPGHLVRSRDWCVKGPEVSDEPTLAAERRYLEENPHESWVKQVCAIGGIDYGRVDYGLLAGRPQLWEINTNPVLMRPPWRYDERVLAHQWWFRERIVNALREVAAVDAEEDGAAAQLTSRERLVRGAARMLHRRRVGTPISTPRSLEAKPWVGIPS